MFNRKSTYTETTEQRAAFEASKAVSAPATVDLDETAKSLIAEGGRLWQKPGITRVYLTDVQLLKKAGIEVSADSRTGYQKIGGGYASKTDARKATGTTANYYQV